MDDFFDLLQKLKNYACYPVVLASTGLAGMYLLSLLGIAESGSLNDNLSVIFNTLFCAFVLFYSCKSIKRALTGAAAHLAADMLLFAERGAHFSLLSGVLFTVIVCLIMNKLPFVYACIAAWLAAFIFGFSAMLLYDPVNELLVAFAEHVRGRGALFGTLSNALNLLIGSGWDELFYHKSYGATTAVNGRVITGAIDIVRASETAPRAAAEYLSGKFMATVFIPLGVFAALFKRMNSERMTAFLFAFALSALFGDERLFYLLLFLISPLIYVGVLIIVFISYTACSLVDLRIGFESMPNLYELVTHFEKPVYFALIGLMIAVTSYFAVRLIIAKFNLLSASELPHSVKKLVDALGGEKNIIKIANGAVEVANPNLIDVLRLDCDIHENIVNLQENDMNIIRRLT